MIDWINLAANSLWILGCAIALATLSYASWQASMTGEKLRVVLAAPGPQTYINLAGVLFCAGLAWTSDSTLQIVLWALLAVLFLVQFGINVWPKRKQPEKTTDTDEGA